MKKISVNQIISVTRKQPFTGNSLKFLQDGLDEDKAGIIKAFITQNLGSYSLTTPYVISGCVVSDAGKDVTAGEIFYGGKYYQTTAVNGTTNVAQFILTKTQDAVADPLEFTNGDILNVHDIYKYVATDVASGGDFTSAALVSAYGAGKITFNVNSANQNTTSVSYIDLTSATYTTPNDGLTRVWLILFNGVSKVNTSSGDGTKIEIYNSTTTTQLATSKVYLDVLAATIDIMELSVSLQKVVSLAPNTTIKIRFLSVNGGAINLEDNNFSMIEI